MKLQELFEADEGRTLIGLKIMASLITPDTKNKEWGGSFICNNYKLTSLEGCPKRVIGDFECKNNNLSSLVGAPSIVEGSFDCRNNILTTLEGCPKKINGSFGCSDNNLTSLEGCPNVVNGHFWCENNNLASLKDIHKMVKVINGKFDCPDNLIKSNVLGLLLIVGLQKIQCNTKWCQILNKHLGKGRAGVIAAQAELIEAGLEEYAKL